MAVSPFAFLRGAAAVTAWAARIAGHCSDDTDSLDRALAAFAESCGDQTERDHAARATAIKDGRVKAPWWPSAPDR
jgi:hypothetical protein